MSFHDSDAYKGARHDLMRHMKSPKKVLDIGCNTGATGSLINKTFGTEVKVWGIDYNPNVINEATKKLHHASVVNLNDSNEFKTYLNQKSFDTILMGDVLEHVLDPKNIIKIAVDHLGPKGQIIISLPNSGFYTTIWHFFMQRWPRNKRGLYDKTHLHLYFRNNLNELAPKGYRTTIVERKYRWLESRGSRFDFLLKIFNYIPYFRNILTFQFLLVIKN